MMISLLIFILVILKRRDAF